MMGDRDQRKSLREGVRRATRFGYVKIRVPRPPTDARTRDIAYLVMSLVQWLDAAAGSGWSLNDVTTALSAVRNRVREVLEQEAGAEIVARSDAEAYAAGLSIEAKKRAPP